MSKRPSKPQRGFSWAVHKTLPHPEQRSLLIATDEQPEEHQGEHEELLADEDGLYPPYESWTSDHPRPPNPHAHLPIYTTIHRVRRDVIQSIDDPYSLEQLKTPRMNICIVRPLVERFYEMQDVSIIYCLLVNRTQFIREQSFASHHQTVNFTRALLCELLAEKILRRFHEHNPGPKGLLLLANILVTGFEPFQNAPKEVFRDTDHYRAIQTNTQSHGWAFEPCQRVIEAIYRGKLVYTPNAFIDIIPDHWKRKPISLYDPRRAPLLNQYRLIVPRTRSWIEVGQFIILLTLYMVVMTKREHNSKYLIWEFIFDVYAFGWTIDQLSSMLEHGWKVYSQNLWTFLDVTFMIIYTSYMVIRIYALNLANQHNAVHMSHTALDILAVAAPILIPRLAFNLMSENILFVSLRAMMSDFFTLTLLAIWCFAGFLLSMKWMHQGSHEPITISKWLIWIWFGLDGTGLQRSPDFHWLLGPVLMVTFAFLGNTLFLTILVSMLSNTFSLIVTNATAEVQYRRAVLTFECVKSDAIFAYMPPFNILALLVMMPLKWLLNPRYFHKTHVLIIRVLNAPLLLAIGLFERETLWDWRNRRHFPDLIGWKTKDKRQVPFWTRFIEFWSLDRFSVHGDIVAVFDEDPPQHVLAEIEAHDDLHSETFHRKIAADLDMHFSHHLHEESMKMAHDMGSVRLPKSPYLSRDTSKGAAAKDTNEDAKLEAEFPSSSEDDGPRSSSNAESSSSRRRNKEKQKKRPTIFQSATDRPEPSSARREHNYSLGVRLSKLEETTQRIEHLLMELVGTSPERDPEADPGDMDDMNTRAELRNDVRFEDI